MCGRFSLIHSPEDVEQFFALAEVEAFPPRYNIAPTQPVLVVAAAPRRPEGSNLPNREAKLMRWGLLPSWVKDPKDFPLLINARSETAATKPSFRAAMRHRRALLPASGFYEWQRDAASKQSQAYWVPVSDGAPVAFAAVHETYISKDGSELDTVAILTAEAGAPFSQIHNRIPVVIQPADFDRWLDCKTQEPRDVNDLLTPPPDRYFVPVPVSDLVNKVANTGPQVQEAVAPKDFIAGAKQDKPTAKPRGDDDQPSLF
ncbi:MAG: SOS response-associated peptidase [Pseudomonadota bacterium]